MLSVKDFGRSFSTTLSNHANLKPRMKFFASGAGNVASQANHCYSWISSHHLLDNLPNILCNL